MTAVPHDTTDILISGGGVAGLAAACAFGSAGFDVICVEPNSPVTRGEAEGSDLRNELIQVAAVAVSWIEAIDRRTQNAGV